MIAFAYFRLTITENKSAGMQKRKLNEWYRELHLITFDSRPFYIANFREKVSHTFYMINFREKASHTFYIINFREYSFTTVPFLVIRCRDCFGACAREPSQSSLPFVFLNLTTSSKQHPRYHRRCTRNHLRSWILFSN